MKKAWLLLLIFCVQFRCIVALEGEYSILAHVSEVLSIPLDMLSLEKFPAGVSNHVYRVSRSDGKCFVAKIFTKKSYDEVLKLDMHVQELQRLGFKIPESLSISLYDNAFPLQIFEYKNGKHITDNELSESAELMGNIHLVNPGSIGFPKTKFKDKTHYESLFERCKEWPYSELLKNIYNNLDLRYLDKIPTGVIHGDFSYSNLICDEDHSLSIIDFDHLCCSYLLSDLVRCQMFYGFDEEGNLMEESVKRFVSSYDAVRPLSVFEKMNFFTHMKLMMIDTALEMFYHLHILKDLSISTINHSDNKTLMPELLAKKILNLSEKRAINFQSSNHCYKVPIVFFGLSGVGKTTLINAIEKTYPELFYIPKFTCTRSPRLDDNLEKFEYVSVEEFLKLDEEDVFLLTMHEGSRYYGYQKSHLTFPEKYPLLNCSAYGISNAENLNAILVLVEGDAQKGLKERENVDYQELRTEVNARVFESFFSKKDFLIKMDIIHLNQWSKLDDSIERLIRSLAEKIDEYENGISNKKAA